MLEDLSVNEIYLNCNLLLEFVRRKKKVLTMKSLIM